MGSLAVYGQYRMHQHLDVQSVYTAMANNQLVALMLRQILNLILRRNLTRKLF